MNEYSVTTPGKIPGCKHEHQREDGCGTVAYFMECVDCLAKLSYYTGDDPYLNALEASQEPPDDY